MKPPYIKAFIVERDGVGSVRGCKKCGTSPCLCPPAVWVESRSKAALSTLLVCGVPDPANYYGRWHSKVTVTGSYNNTPETGNTQSGNKTVTSEYAIVNGACQLTITAVETKSQNFFAEYGDGTTYTSNANWSGTYTNTIINGQNNETCTGSFNFSESGVYDEPPGSGNMVPYTNEFSQPWCPDTSPYPGSTTTRAGDIITAKDDLFPDAIANLDLATWGDWSRISYPRPDECWDPADAPRYCWEVHGPYASAGASSPYIGRPTAVAVSSSEYRIVVKVPLSRYVKATWKEVRTPASGSPVITDRVWEQTFPAGHHIEEKSPDYTLTPTEIGNIYTETSIVVMDLKVICTPPAEREDYSTQTAFPAPPASEDAWKLFNAEDRPDMPGLGKTYRWNGSSYVEQSRLADCFRSCNYGCTDSNASNYDPLADIDDGSCVGWE